MGSGRCWSDIRIRSERLSIDNNTANHDFLIRTSCSSFTTRLSYLNHQSNRSKLLDTELSPPLRLVTVWIWRLQWVLTLQQI